MAAQRANQGRTPPHPQSKVIIKKESANERGPWLLCNV